MASFADINVSQGSVATYARCSEILDIRLTANLSRNLPVKKILNRLRIDRIMVMSLWSRFLAHPSGVVIQVRTPCKENTYFLVCDFSVFNAYA